MLNQITHNSAYEIQDKRQKTKNSIDLRVFLYKRISNCSNEWLSSVCSILLIVALSVISPYMKLHLQLFCITSARLYPEILQKDSEQ